MIRLFLALGLGLAVGWTVFRATSSPWCPAYGGFIQPSRAFCEEADPVTGLYAGPSDVRWTEWRNGQAVERPDIAMPQADRVTIGLMVSVPFTGALAWWLLGVLQRLLRQMGTHRFIAWMQHDDSA